MFWFCVILVLVNILFLSLGTLLYAYAEAKGITLPTRTDDLYPLLAFNYLGQLGAVIFVLGIVAATYSTIDSVLTSLTTTFCIDFLKIQQRPTLNQPRILKIVHLGFSVLLVLLMILFQSVGTGDLITNLLKAVGFTYGPLLGLYAFGLFTRWSIRDAWVPLVCVLAPLLSFILHKNSLQWFNGYQFGFEILIVNGLLTFLGLLLLANHGKVDKLN